MRSISYSSRHLLFLFSIILTITNKLEAASVFNDSSRCDDYVGSENMRDYINHLMDLAQQQTENVRIRKFDYVFDVHGNISKAFKAAGCPDLWSGNFTREERDSISFAKFVANYDPQWGDEVTPAVVDVVRDLEVYFHYVARDHVFASCIFSQSRDLIFKWITTECEKGLFKYITDGLKDFPIPRVFDEPEYEKNLHASFALYAIAFTKAMDCGQTKEDSNRLVGNIVKNLDENLCYAAIDSFQSEACFSSFTRKCPKVHRCFEEYFSQFQSMAAQTFSGEGSLLRKCLESSRAYWGSDRPPNVPTQSQVLAGGIRIYLKVRNIVWNEKAKPYIRSVMKSMLRADTCDCNSEDIEWNYSS